MSTTQSRRIVKHPQFNPTNRANDIAIVFVRGRFDLSLEGVSVIALPKQDRKVPSSVQASTVGFGFIAPQGQTGPTSSILVADVSVIAPQTCERLFRRAFDGHLCARDKARENAANVCLGDNGNGLFALPSALDAANRANDPPHADGEDPPETHAGFNLPQQPWSRERRAADADPPQEQPRERPILVRRQILN